MKENTTKNSNSLTLKNNVMKRFVNTTFAAVTLFSIMTLALVLGGCGGGSGGVSTEIVSGTAAVGKPLSGQVSLKDSSTPALQKSTVIGSDGSYAIDVTGMKAPYVLQATGSVDGEGYKLLSFAEGTGTANINPLSHVIVASAVGDDDDDKSDIFEKTQPEKNHKIKTNLTRSLAVVLAKLKPLLKQYSSERTNPITAHYITKHIDLDDIFENVKITVANGILSIINTKTSAVIFSGKVSDIANGIFDNGALPPAASAPAVPAGLTAVGGTGLVKLSWSPVSSATSYNLYYATTSGVTTTSGTKISPVSSPYIQTGLAANTSYYYVVTAVNSAGESSASAPVAAVTAATTPVPTLPSAPTGMSATGGTNQVTLSWGAVNTATSYNVYYATTSGVTTASGTKLNATTSPAVLTGLAEGTTYYYVVTAVNNVGEGASSVQVAATTLSPIPTPVVPAAPVGVAAVGGANQATITWPAVSGASSYNVYRSTTAGVTTTNGTKLAAVTSPCIMTGLAAGTTYYFIVTAVNSVGEGTASAQTSAATNAAPAQTCGSCHAIPPAVGAHARHTFTSCATCHGTGYSSSTVNAATHINGVNDVTNSIWNASTQSCAASCHGARSW